MNSVLKNAKIELIDDEYFPYIVIKDSLDEALYNKLMDNYPTLEEISLACNKSIKNNFRYDMGAEYVLYNEKICPEWKEFVKYHVSEKFYLEVIKLFEKHIKKKYPNIEKKFNKKLNEIKTRMRRNIKLKNLNNPKEVQNLNKNFKEDLTLDCQISMNSPVTKKSSVRGLHIDYKDKLFVGLLYCRNEKDKSKGGDLEIYKFKNQNNKIMNNNFNIYQKKLKKLEEENSNEIEKIKTIKYDKNVLVFFINTKNALHSVSVREKTKHNRRLINFIGSVNHFNLFK